MPYPMTLAPTLSHNAADDSNQNPRAVGKIRSTFRKSAPNNVLYIRSSYRDVSAAYLPPLHSTDGTSSPILSRTLGFSP